jgi:ribosome biogenesis protein BMS1
MMDRPQVADLVLLLVDGAFGFEMETFEFLNLLQVYDCGAVHTLCGHLALP